MSWLHCPDPVPGDAHGCDSIDTVILPRMRDLGGFAVGRVLPAPQQAMVGPFIFLDQMGPTAFALRKGVDIRPHPHISLATVTYLLDGEITHRDSLGTEQVIRPGEVNWMSAGRGIVHSERSSVNFRARTANMFGLQTWVALPANQEESAPWFAHVGKHELPVIEDGGVQIRLVAGAAWGQRSPVVTASDTIYADAVLAPGALLPVDAEHEERALYVLTGTVEVGGEPFGSEQLLVLRAGKSVRIRNAGSAAARLIVLGGATMDGPRYIWWNFVSSRRDRIEQAKEEWKTGRFDTVPGDAEEYISLPDGEMGEPRRIPTR